MSRIPELTRRRLEAQRIEHSEFSTPTQVVEWMLALQAQDLPGAKWSIGLRAPGTTLVDVDEALARGEIVRSWPMRGTLHLVPARDIGWMLGLTADRTINSLARRHRELGLDDATFGQAADVASGLLAGGLAVPRARLFDAFEAAGIDTGGQRAPHLLGYLHQRGLLVLGPMQGNAQAVALLDEWVPHPNRPDRDEALGRFVLRYFSSHGPATVKDFLWWTKLLAKDAAIGLEIAREHLEELVIDGTSYWMSPELVGGPDATHSTAHSSSRVHALPGFDEYLLGYRNRDAALDPAILQAVVPGNNGMFLATIVDQGRIVGTWRRKSGSDRTVVTASPFEALPDRVWPAFGASVRAYGRFLGTRTEVVVGSVQDPAIDTG